MENKKVLTSNNIPIKFTANNSVQLDTTSNIIKDGYIYLKQFFDREKILSIREEYLGLFKNKSNLIPYGIKGHPAYEMVRRESFKKFAHNEKILSLIADITNNKNIKVLDRKILRHFCKNSYIASKAHIDYVYLNKGTKNIITAWIPLGDCSIQTGGLIYLQNSHKIKYKSLKNLFPQYKNEKWITNDLEELANRTSKKWMFTDYKAGDIVLHNPFIVHASLDCSTYYMRVSADIRYMLESEKVDPRWLNDWRANDGF